ncbi:MAG: metallophosphoesterase [Tannerellaceae bacterium]|jgi:predicted MPP superfamily phosphohydrolase|nr:metallophosphoesterase [Tannerellaceae bacterium]
MRVFLSSVIAQLLLNPYVFWRGWQALAGKKRWRALFATCFTIEILTFLVGYFFHKELPDDVMVGILFYCGTWYVGLLYATLALCVVEAVRFSHRLHPWYPGWIVAHWSRVKRTLFVLVIAGLSVLLYAGHRRVMQPVVRHVHIDLPRGPGGRFDSLTVVMMSDLHIGEMIGKELVQRYVWLSNAQRPDLVVLAGDLLDYESRFAEDACIADDLRRLEAPWGVYAINGNHEYRANRHAKKKWIQTTGAILLVDSTVLVNESFYLVGRDDMVNLKRRPLRSLMQPLDARKPAIVLDHQPWSLAELAMNGAALGLHGHTHNGQWWPYPLVMKFVYECPYGYYRKGGTQYYVSSGIGAAGPPYRIGTVSELVVLHIRFI